MTTITAEQIEALEYVPNAPIRKLVEECLEEGTITYALLSREIGFSPKRGDPTRIKRLLGIKAKESGRYSQYVNYELAVAIVEACGAYPVDYGV